MVDMVKVYKLGTCHVVDPTAVDSMVKQGFSLDPDAVPSETPTLDLSQFDNAKLLHIAAVSNLEVDTGATREQLEGVLQEAWAGLGYPEGWLEAAHDAPAPVAAEDLVVPVVNEVIEPVAAADFQAPPVLELDPPAETPSEQPVTEGGTDA